MVKIARISGRVLEKYTKRPVSRAIVRVNETTVLTDENGYYTITVPRGRVTFEVSHSGFHPYLRSLNVRRMVMNQTILLDSIIRAL